jgi:hypothetical protein
MGKDKGLEDKVSSDFASAKLNYDRKMSEEKYSMMDILGTIGMTSLFYCMVNALLGPGIMFWASLGIGIFGIAAYKILGGK